MDIDFGMSDMSMNFGMNMGNMGNSSTAAPSYNANDRVDDMDFENAFTDDDFSFFDRPAPTPSAPPQPVMTHSRNVSGVSALATSGVSPSAFNDVHLSGPGPPGTSGLQHAWTPGGFMDGLTPRSMDHTMGPPTHLQTPAAQYTESIPPTPNVHLEHEPKPPLLLRAQSTPQLNNSFEPIPFAPYHREADGKYTLGKFALPSPPTDQDDDVFKYEPSTRSAPPSSPNGPSRARPILNRRPTGWRTKYDAETDPRIRLVQKLIGVKRKPLSQGTRNPPKASPWNTSEDWDKDLLPPAEQETKSSPGSDGSEDDDEEDEDLDMESSEGVSTPMLSRPSTPPPAYLPLGPTLLHTHFEHDSLLPLSVPLRPHGVAITPLNFTHPGTGSHLPPPSVPTPVSPAATMGAASERSKSLETFANEIAVQVVDNPIWAESWLATTAVATKPSLSVWTSDVKLVLKLLEGVEWLRTGLSISELFGIGMSFHAIIVFSIVTDGLTMA